MAPKKKQTNGTSHEKPAKTMHSSPSEHKPKNSSEKAKGSSKKRKSPPTTTTSTNKSRRSARNAPTITTDPEKLLNYLLSPPSLALCRPKDETEDLQLRGAETRAYSSSIFTPFEELVCALVLSRPIGHTLGLRSIRTLFNEPYEFTTAKKIHAAGYEGVRKALDVARTQHRQKTAEEIVGMATMVIQDPNMDEDDSGMYGLREACHKSVQEEREMLQSNIKGLGKTGLDIFGRRIQGLWEEWYPFMDERTGRAMEALGLPGDAEEMKEMIEEKWEQLQVGDIEAQNEAEKKRMAFVRILERAIGADLEGNIEAVKAEMA